MIRCLMLVIFFIINNSINADTIDHYVNISNAIPQMEIKADAQSQAWARSARNVLTITTETLAETLLQANDLAKAQGAALFCLPPNTSLNSVTMNGIILQTYKEISSQRSDKDKMTISQIAWLGVTKTYPCKQQSKLTQLSPILQHISHH